MEKRSLKERFLEKVAIRDNGCHEWTHYTLPNGYGQISRDGKACYAHRVAYELAHGEVPQGQFVLHTCDNRRCVNPEHLFLGTFDDNMADMVRKQRQAHGARNGHAKLSVSQVQAIRKESGTHREIASRFGVSQPLVTMIRAGQIWKLA